MSVSRKSPLKMRREGTTNRRNPALKVAAATATATAAVAATLILAKKGKLNPVEGGNKIIEGIKAPLKKGTDSIFNFIAGSKTIAKTTTKIGEIQNKIAPKINKVTQKASEITEGVIADVETTAANIEGSIKGFAQKVPTYTQEARCKFNGLAGQAKDAINGLKEKDAVKKAVAFAKDVPSKAVEIAEGIKSKATALFGKVFKKA